MDDNSSHLQFLYRINLSGSNLESISTSFRPPSLQSAISVLVLHV